MMTRRWVITIALLVTTVGLAVYFARPRGIEAAGDRVAAAREFVELLAAGRFADATARFDDTMKRAMSPAQLQQMWQEIIKQQGSFKGIVGTQPGRKATCRWSSIPPDGSPVCGFSRRPKVRP
jgi:hypothetical protein